MEDEIREILTDLKPKKGPRQEQRPYFGLGLMACASFLLVFSFVVPGTDRWWWVAAGIVFLGAGAFILDRAKAPSPTKRD